MTSPIVDKIGRETVKEDRLSCFVVGDTVKVHAKIREGDKERVQMFEGTVIARDGGGAAETFTIRRISHGVGVERVFPLHSPHITKITLVRHGHSRRAKLYYLRDRKGKKARLRETRR